MFSYNNSLETLSLPCLLLFCSLKPTSQFALLTLPSFYSHEFECDFFPTENIQLISIDVLLVQIFCLKFSSHTSWKGTAEILQTKITHSQTTINWCLLYSLTLYLKQMHRTGNVWSLPNPNGPLYKRFHTSTSRFHDLHTYSSPILPNFSGDVWWKVSPNSF